MPFIPHSETEIRDMLGAVGAPSIDALFDEIPESLRCGRLDGVPESLTEMQVARLMQERADEDRIALNFIGAGAYEHHVPAAVWEITTRGEFYSAYTPYQAEASQGTLQVIYEFQSMLCGLTDAEVANASLYDGATALAESVLMAVRSNRKNRSGRILMPQNVHPFYREVTHVITNSQAIDQVVLPFDDRTGRVDVAALDDSHADATALVIQQPNFFGTMEDVDALTDWAHEHNVLVIAVVNPISLGLLRPPGQWGTKGADIICGEGQPLGAPLSSGGPYFGFMCTRQAMARQMPGRICGKTVDMDGTPGYTLTLQAREQHIRRSKATSNICTNQGLLATAATVHMALLGPDGLQRVASSSHANLRRLLAAVADIDGVSARFDSPAFHEAVLRLDRPVEPVLDAMAEAGILGGVGLARWYEGFEDSILVCTTETKTDEDIDQFADALRAALSAA